MVMIRQIRVWRHKVELARGEELQEFQDKVNKELAKLGEAVEKVYVIGVGIDMVVTAVLNVESKEEN